MFYTRSLHKVPSEKREREPRVEIPGGLIKAEMKPGIYSFPSLHHVAMWVNERVNFFSFFFFIRKREEYRRTTRKRVRSADLGSVRNLMVGVCVRISLQIWDPSLFVGRSLTFVLSPSWERQIPSGKALRSKEPRNFSSFYHTLSHGKTTQLK